jgi:hypothetical protein
MLLPFGFSSCSMRELRSRPFRQVASSRSLMETTKTLRVRQSLNLGRPPSWCAFLSCLRSSRVAPQDPSGSAVAQLGETPRPHCLTALDSPHCFTFCLLPFARAPFAFCKSAFCLLQERLLPSAILHKIQTLESE